METSRDHLLSPSSTQALLCCEKHDQGMNLWMLNHVQQGSFHHHHRDPEQFLSLLFKHTGLIILYLHFYPKRLTYVWLVHILHLHWWHTAHQEQLGVQSLAQGRWQGIELTTFWLLNDFSTFCTTVAPILLSNMKIISMVQQAYTPYPWQRTADVSGHYPETPLQKMANNSLV